MIHSEWLIIWGEKKNQPTVAHYQELMSYVALRFKWDKLASAFILGGATTFQILMNYFSDSFCCDVILVYYFFHVIFICSRPKYFSVVAATSGAVDVVCLFQTSSSLIAFIFKWVASQMSQGHVAFGEGCLCCSSAVRVCMSQLMHRTAVSYSVFKQRREKKTPNKTKLN